MLEPYWYVGPGLILIALVMIVPLIVGIGYSFQNIQILNPFKTQGQAPTERAMRSVE